MKNIQKLFDKFSERVKKKIIAAKDEFMDNKNQEHKICCSVCGTKEKKPTQ